MVDIAKVLDDICTSLNVTVFKMPLVDLVISMEGVGEDVLLSLNVTVFKMPLLIKFVELVISMEDVGEDVLLLSLTTTPGSVGPLLSVVA